MPRCAELFCESGFQGRQLQILVDKASPGFGCEKEKCSPFSPGPVQDEEEVAFLLINPLHYDEVRGVVVPSAFQELTNRDLSVLRLAHTTRDEAQKTRDELVARGADRIPPQLRTVSEVCIAKVSELRAPLPAHGRLLGVFDTALEDKKSHASIFTTEAALNDKRLRKTLRERVHKVMTARQLTFPTLIGSLP